MKKLLVLLLIAGLLLVTVSGCGAIKKFAGVVDELQDIGEELEDDINNDNDQDNDEDENENDDEDEDQVVFEDNVYYPEDVMAVLSKFQEFGFEVAEIKEDESSSMFSIHYQVLGTEEINGVMAEKILYTNFEDGESKVYTFWFNEEWDCVKAMRGEEELEPYEGGGLTMALSIYVNYVKTTQTIVDEDGILDTFSYSLEDTRTESSEVGTMEVYEISSVFSKIITTYGLVDIDGEKNFALIRSDVKDSPSLWELKVTHAVTR